MFEQEIELTKHRILDSIVKGKSFVYLHELLANKEIEQAYRTYFKAELDWWLFNERRTRNSLPNFRFEESFIKPALEQLDIIYEKAAGVNLEQMELFVLSAVKANLNFRVRPRVALKWFVFRGKYSLSCEEILLRLNYFAEYSYIKEGFSNWLNSNEISDIEFAMLNENEFDEAIQRIDTEFISDLSVEELVELMSPLFDFFSISPQRDNELLIPIEAAIIFFDDKKLYSIAVELEKIYKEKGIEYLTKYSLLEYINNIDLSDSHTFEEFLPKEDENIQIDSESYLNENTKASENDMHVIDDNIIVYHSLSDVSPQNENTLTFEQELIETEDTSIDSFEEESEVEPYTDEKMTELIDNIIELIEVITSN